MIVECLLRGKFYREVIGPAMFFGFDGWAMKK